MPNWFYNGIKLLQSKLSDDEICKFLEELKSKVEDNG